LLILITGTLYHIKTMLSASIKFALNRIKK